jgi:hypothetical protein
MALSEKWVLEACSVVEKYMRASSALRLKTRPRCAVCAVSRVGTVDRRGREERERAASSEQRDTAKSFFLILFFIVE